MSMKKRLVIVNVRVRLRVKVMVEVKITLRVCVGFRPTITTTTYDTWLKLRDKSDFSFIPLYLCLLACLLASLVCLKRLYVYNSQSLGNLALKKNQRIHSLRTLSRHFYDARWLEIQHQQSAGAWQRVQKPR